MKTSHFVGLLLALSPVVPWQSAAMVTTYRTEPVHSPSWVKGLDAIVNHSSRISGIIGPFGPTGRFQYSGNATNFNDVLKAYGQVSQPAHILYLTPATQPADAPRTLNYELSINHDGQGYLHLHVTSGTDMDTIHLPPTIKIESLPDISVPLAAENEEQQAAARQAIRNFLQTHSKASGVVEQAGDLQIGSLAPVLSGLGADGNAIDAAQPWPAALSNKTVLVVFWSAQEPASAALLDRLKAIRKEFGANNNFQIVSFCIDADWVPWMRMVSRRVDYGQGELRLHDDPKWWQVIQDPNTPGTGTRYGVGDLPAAFLIGPDRRIIGAKIAPGELRNAVVAALRIQR